MATKRKVLTWLLTVGGVILLVGSGTWIWLATQSGEYARRKLPGLAAKATDSLYRIEAGSVDIDFATRDITLTDVELTPNARHWAKLGKDLDLPPVRFSMHIPKLHIRHLSIKRYLEDKELVADGLHIVEPIIRITRLASAAPPKEDEPPPKIERVRVGSITIENPDVEFADESGKTRTVYASKGGSIALRDWRFELEGEQDTTRLFYAAHSQFNLQSVVLPDPSGFYRYTVGNVAYNQTGSVLRVQDLRIAPRLSREAFLERVGFQKEIYTVRFPYVRLDGLDWKSLMAGTALVATGGELRNGDINIYMDRVPPPNLQSKDGKFPHQMLMKLALPVYVPRLTVSNGQFAYTERNYKTMQAGTVCMTGIAGAVSNVTNMPARVRKNAVCSIDLKGNFKGSKVDAVFRFPLNATKDGAFSVDGGMTSMDGTRLNDITKPLALADIRRLQIDGIRFHVDGSEAGARARFTMRYHDMDVDLLEKESGEPMNKKHVTTFVADKLLLFRANPMPRKDMRSVQPQVVRDETKSFFNVIWKTLFTGVLQTVGRVGFLDDAVNRKAQKDEEKRKEDVLGPLQEKKERRGLLRRLPGSNRR